jgi:hypothetical protein
VLEHLPSMCHLEYCPQHSKDRNKAGVGAGR